MTEKSSFPDFIPIPEEDLNYSCLALVGISLAAIPIMVLYAALVFLSLPLKCWNLIQQKRAKEQIHRVNAFIREFFDILALLIRYPISKNYQYTSAVGETGSPILLVHGYLHNASAWHYLIARMKKEHLGPIYAIDLGDGSVSGKFWSIKKYAQQLLEKTEQITQETGRKDISIVSHSMGGLVAAAFAKLAPKDAQINMISLGTPFNGTQIALHLASGPNGRSMVPASEFIQELRRGLEENKDHIQFLHIAAKQDLIVPVKSALMGSMRNSNITFDDIGHCGLLRSKSVADQVCKWLIKS